VALFTSLCAGKPRKPGPPAQQPAAPPTAERQPPSVRLSQFTAAHLDRIVGPLDAGITLPRAELAQLRATLTADLAGASEAEKAQYQTAIALCDAVSQAMDEREKATSNAQASSNAPVAQDTHDVRESLPRHGHGSGKAARAGLHQQENENQQALGSAAQKSSFLSSIYARQWMERAPLLRQRIQQLSSEQLQAKRARI